MSADWTTCRVVRDCDGGLWSRGGVGWRLLGEEYSRLLLSTEVLVTLGPLTPVLDADGLPVVRTVGDLTAWHIGKRVRVEPSEDVIEGIKHNSEGRTTVYTFGGALDAPSSEPCEVRDAPDAVLVEEAEDDSEPTLLQRLRNKLDAAEARLEAVRALAQHYDGTPASGMPRAILNALERP